MLDEVLAVKIQQRHSEGLYRQINDVERLEGPYLWINQERYLSFCSSDYLGLSSHPRVLRAFVDAANEHGISARSSQVVAGHFKAHRELEEALADFLGYERVLLYSSGYMANLGVISGLFGREDVVFEDRRNHASLIDACQLSRATRKRYQHLDIEHLRERLQEKERYRHQAFISDGVFSMTGAIAPVAQLAKLAKSTESSLFIDDAHGFGVIGKEGRGVLSVEAVSAKDVDITMIAFSKALGTFGAAVGANELMVDWLVQSSRTSMYTTAMPPALAAASLESLKCMREESWRREQLQKNIQLLSQGFREMGFSHLASMTPIQCLLVGSSDRAIKLSNRLKQRGILIKPIRQPSVPAGHECLRITLTAEHSEQMIQQLLGVLEECQNDLN